jgi:multidrug efflux pump subunit AcrB
MAATESERNPAEGVGAQNGKRGPIAFFARNSVAANLLMVSLVVGGLVAVSNLPLQNFPKVTPSRITVSVHSPGSSASEVNEDINRRLEEALIGLEGIDGLQTTAVQGLGMTTLELKTFANRETVMGDVQDALDRMEAFPPPNAERPEVEFVQSKDEVISVAVASSHASEDHLRSAAEQIRTELQQIPSLSHVSLRGARDREVTIELSEEALRRYDLSFSQVAGVMRRDSVNLSFGQLRTDSGEVVLHTLGKRTVGEEFADIPLLTRPAGAIVRLGDVADISDGFADENIVSTLDGKPAVFVRVNSLEGTSIADISGDVRNWLDSYEPPPNVEVSIWSDQAEPSVDRITDIMRNAAIGLILVFLLLILVFDLRVAAWITAGIPVSFIGAMTFFGLADMSLNIFTIFGFFLMIGLVVDDAVVVGESIASERALGRSAVGAAISGARSVVGPVTVGVLTTMLAFVPMLFGVGSYESIRPFFYVTVFVLAVSLIEAFLILPAHLSHRRNLSRWPLKGIQQRVNAWLDKVRDKTVAPAVTWSMQHVGLTMAGALLVMFLALALVATGAVRVLIFDEQDSITNDIQVNMLLPVGSPFENTLDAVEQVVDAAYVADDRLGGNTVRSVRVLAGNTAESIFDVTSPNGSHVASVVLKLHPKPIRRASLHEIEREWRSAVGNLAGVETMRYRSSRVRSLAKIAVLLKHDNQQVLRQAATELRSAIAAVPGTYELDDSMSLGKRHLEIDLTPAGYAAGLTPIAIGTHLRNSFYGTEVQRIQRGQEEIKVVLRYPEETRKSLHELANERIRLPGATTGDVPINAVATFSETRELKELIRADGKQAALVSANVDEAKTTPIRVRRHLSDEVFPSLRDKYPGLILEPSGGWNAEQKMFRNWALVIPIMLIAMYALMAAFLRSYWKPLAAVAGIPLAAAGAVLGHWVLGWDLTGLSIFGIIGVSGVVVNDVLVLLDRYSKIRRAKDVPAIAALSLATNQRFRAVFLTSATTLLGLLPLLYERSEGLTILVPIAVSIIGGLIMSGFFVLFGLPTLIMLFKGSQD